MPGEASPVHDVAPSNRALVSDPMSQPSTTPTENKRQRKPIPPSRRSTLLSNVSIAPSSWRIRRASHILGSTFDIRGLLRGNSNAPVDDNSHAPHGEQTGPSQRSAGEVLERPNAGMHRNFSADAVMTRAPYSTSGAPRRVLGSVIGSIKRRLRQDGSRGVDSNPTVHVESPLNQFAERNSENVLVRPPRVQSLTDPLPSLMKNRLQKIGSYGNILQDRRNPESGPRDFGLVWSNVPEMLVKGVLMNKISNKGEKPRMFRIDIEQELIRWESKKSGIISIRKIQQLRTGSDVEYWRNHFGFGPEYENRWLTISYLRDTRYKTLHIVAENEEMFLAFSQVISQALATRTMVLTLLSHQLLPPDNIFVPFSHPNIPHAYLSYEERQLLWERYHWKRSDFSSKTTCDFTTIEHMACRFSLGVSTSELRAKFACVDPNGTGRLDFRQFQEFWRNRRRRCDVKDLLKSMGNTHGEIDFEGFQNFLVNEQKDTRSSAELRALFLLYASPSIWSTDVRDTPKLEQSPQSPRLVLPLEAFTAYLMSSDNAPFLHQNDGIHQDMTRPLSEYYISSSHNTYLVGNQVVGDSTVEGYIITLLNSCRSVELDIYDGDKEPIITHGGTLTSKVPLRDMCEAIAKHAFVKSPYPIIISAEIHCGLSQQDKVAEIMKQCFGDALVDKRLDGDLQGGQLPSPEMLKRRILLKAKNLYAVEMATDSLTSLFDSVVEADAKTDATATAAPSRNHSPERRGSFGFNLQRRRSRSNTVSPLTQYSSYESMRPPKDGQSDGTFLENGQNTLLPPTPSQASLRTTKGISLNLAALLVYTVGVRFRGLGKKEHYAVEHMFSLSEKKADKLLKDGNISYFKSGDMPEASGSTGSMLDLIKHCQTHLVRVYPKGMRLLSTNYLPHRYWAAGAQLVSLNWQTSDLGYIINRAMFLRNGQSGYILKPSPLLANGGNEDSVLQRSRYVFKVKIISGQQIPRRKDRDSYNRPPLDKNTMDPYVQVIIHVPDWPDASKAAPIPNDWMAPDALGQYEAGSSPTKSTRRPSFDRSKIVSGSAASVQARTGAMKNNGFDPKWQESLSLEFEVAGDMLDLVFVQFIVRDEMDNDEGHSLSMYCIPMGCLKQGYRHLPLHDQQMTAYLFATLFVHIDLQKKPS